MLNLRIGRTGKAEQTFEEKHCLLVNQVVEEDCHSCAPSQHPLRALLLSY